MTRAFQVFDIRDYGGVADSTGPGNGTDNSSAITSAIAAACGGGYPAATQVSGSPVYIPPAAAGMGYRVASRIDVEAPVWILGTPGASAPLILSNTAGRAGSRIYVDAGLEAGFDFYNGQISPSGGDATGARIEGIEVVCSQGQSVTGRWAANTSYSLGAVVAPNTWNVLYYKCVYAGTSGSTEPDWRHVAHGPSYSAPWLANHAYFYGNFVRPTSAALAVNNFYATHPLPGAASANTGSTEPSWNFTIGGTTTDGSVTWTALGDGSFFQDGSVIWQAFVCSGMWIRCPIQIIDCAVRGAQRVGVGIFGNTTIVGSNAQKLKIDGLTINLPSPLSTGGAVGLYLRGGELCRGKYRDINVVGTASSPQGLVTGSGPGGLPNIGGSNDPNEHGIVDEAFSLGNSFLDCTVTNCGGYDYWAAGDESETSFVNCVSNAGRIRLDASAQWVGPINNATMWNTTGIGYASTATSLVGNLGVVNPITHLVSASIDVRNTIDPNWAYTWRVLADSGTQGWEYQSYDTGQWTHQWANGAVPCISITNGLAPTDPPSQFHVHGGLYLGAARLRLFDGDTDFRGPARAGSRLKGDVIFDRDTVDVNGVLGRVVLTPGYMGIKWAHGVFLTKQQAVVPSDAFIATHPGFPKLAYLPNAAYTTGTTEPDWTTCQTTGFTIFDGAGILICKGAQPTLARWGAIGYALP